MKKFLAAIISASIIFIGAKVGAVGMPASELMRLDEAPRGEIARPMQQTLTSENSGLNPGYSVTPIQNTRPVAPDDALPNVTATAAIACPLRTQPRSKNVPRQYNQDDDADNRAGK